MVVSLYSQIRAIDGLIIPESAAKLLKRSKLRIILDSDGIAKDVYNERARYRDLAEPLARHCSSLGFMAYGKRDLELEERMKPVVESINLIGFNHGLRDMPKPEDLRINRTIDGAYASFIICGAGIFLETLDANRMIPNLFWTLGGIFAASPLLLGAAADIQNRIFVARDIRYAAKNADKFLLDLKGYLK